MMKGKSKGERKCLDQAAANAGVAALLVPDPKAQCKVEIQEIADGHYRQTLICTQKSGPPIRISRGGTYDASGFVGRLEMAGQTPKGPMTIILNRRLHTLQARAEAESQRTSYRQTPDRIKVP